jgi:hypothetical protein
VYGIAAGGSKYFSKAAMQANTRSPFLGILLVVLSLGPQVEAENFIAVSGGLSPDGKLAVVVRRDEDTSQASVSSDNVNPYLENMATGALIGPLEEIDTMGGGFGHVLANVTAYWNPDGRFVAIRFRAGRLAEEFVIYRMARHNKSYRAVPQKLPEPESGPDGNKIFAHAAHAANMGASFDRWISPTEVSIRDYRYFPPYPAAPDIDFFNGNGVIEVHYIDRGGVWSISSYQKPPE